MNWQTKQKAEEIKILLNEGYDLKDILQKKFNRSTSKLKEHLQVAKGIYTELEFSILEGKEKMEISVKKEVPQQVAEVFSIEKMKKDILRKKEYFRKCPTRQEAQPVRRRRRVRHRLDRARAEVVVAERLEVVPVAAEHL